ncbi:MAG: hypothetical protein U1F25_13015 [Rubrivivax sp.]
MLTAWLRRRPLSPPLPVPAGRSSIRWPKSASTRPISQDVAAAITALLGHDVAAVHIARYFTNGSFAVADIVAALAGGALAFAVLWWAVSAQRGDVRFPDRTLKQARKGSSS